MQSEPSKKKHTIKNKLLVAAIIFFLFLISITIPIVMVTIALQSPDEIILQDEEPLNKKQGLPQT